MINTMIERILKWQPDLARDPDILKSLDEKNLFKQDKIFEIDEVQRQPAFNAPAAGGSGGLFNFSFNNNVDPNFNAGSGGIIRGLFGGVLDRPGIFNWSNNNNNNNI